MEPNTDFTKLLSVTPGFMGQATVSQLKQEKAITMAKKGELSEIATAILNAAFLYQQHLEKHDSASKKIPLLVNLCSLTKNIIALAESVTKPCSYAALTIVSKQQKKYKKELRYIRDLKFRVEKLKVNIERTVNHLDNLYMGTIVGDKHLSHYSLFQQGNCKMIRESLMTFKNVAGHCPNEETLANSGRFSPAFESYKDNCL